MIQFICLFFPAVVATSLFEKLNNQKATIKSSFYSYCLFNLLINGACFLIKTFILNTGFSPLTDNLADMTPNIAFNYLLIALPLSVVFAFICSLLSKNVSITKKENKDEEKTNI